MMDCYSKWSQNYFDNEDQFEIPENWEKRRWYKKYPLSDREEDNLVMDEMEREEDNLVMYEMERESNAD